MKLLICTQKVDKDDPILGFFHSWIIEFSKNFELVTVICLFEGTHDLPENVRVLSLGKEERQSRLQYLIHFYWYVITERKNYDAVFVHMNQIYVVLGGIFWKIMNKKITLWYTHRAISNSLRIANILADRIFTASKESFRLSSKKVSIVGHGIDINKFIIDDKSKINKNKLSILSVGRITRIKSLETLIKSMEILREKNIDFICKIIGPRITEDDTEYYEELKRYILNKKLQNNIEILDPISNDKIRGLYMESDININLTPTGGVDKVVLEGIASSLIPITSNMTFSEILGDYKDDLIFEHKNPNDLSDKIIKIKSIIDNKKDKEIKSYLFNRIKDKFNVGNLVKNISDQIKNL